MILDFVLLADAASMAEGKLHVHGGAITRFNVPQFPFHVPTVAIVIRMILEEGDVGRERTIALDWFRDGEPIPPVSIEGPIQPNPPLVAVEGEEVSAIVVATVNGLPLDEPGLYELVVRLDGEVISRKPVPAVRVEDVLPAPDQ